MSDDAEWFGADRFRRRNEVPLKGFLRGLPPAGAAASSRKHGVSGYRYFRFVHTTWRNAGNLGNTGDLRCAEMTLYDANGIGWPKVPMTALNAPSPYVISASSTNSSFAAWYCCDRTLGDSNRWISGSPVSNTHYVTLDVGSANAFIPTGYFWATDGAGSTYHPADWILYGSNTGNFAGEQVALNTQADIDTGWSASSRRFFTYGSQSGTAYRYYRLNITANNGATDYVSLGRFWLYHDTVAESRANYSSYEHAYDATDSPGSTTNPAANVKTDSPTTATQWLQLNSNVFPCYIRIDCGSLYSPIIRAYKLACQQTTTNRQPKDWTFEGSNNNTDWTVLDTVTGETGWTSQEIRTYTVG